MMSLEEKNIFRIESNHNKICDIMHQILTENKEKIDLIKTLFFETKSLYKTGKLFS